MARPNYKVTTDGSGRKRYFIDGSETADLYLLCSHFYDNYHALPTDASISGTTSQLADNMSASIAFGHGPDKKAGSHMLEMMKAWRASGSGAFSGLTLTQLH